MCEKTEKQEKSCDRCVAKWTGAHSLKLELACPVFRALCAAAACCLIMLVGICIEEPSALGVPLLIGLAIGGIIFVRVSTAKDPLKRMDTLQVSELGLEPNCGPATKFFTIFEITLTVLVLLVMVLLMVGADYIAGACTFPLFLALAAASYFSNREDPLCPGWCPVQHDSMTPKQDPKLFVDLQVDLPQPTAESVEGKV